MRRSETPPPPVARRPSQVAAGEREQSMAPAVSATSPRSGTASLAAPVAAPLARDAVVAGGYAPSPQHALGVAIAPPTSASVEGHGAREAPLGICSRCQGTTEPLARFCRFCGAAVAVAVGESAKSVPAPASVTTEHDFGADRELASSGPAFDAGVAAASSRAITVEVPEKPNPTKIVPTVGQLVVIAKDGSESAHFPITDRLDLGRSEGEVRFPDDRYLSSRHARISVRNGKVYLRDLESPNGVYLRLRGQEEVAISHLALFLIGQQVLRVELLDVAMRDPVFEGDALLFGTPSGPRYARLCQRTVEGTTLDVFHLRKTETILGRESGDIVFSDDPFLSRRHANLRFDLDKRAVFLRDLGSSNGTFRKVSDLEAVIENGDQFRIGQQLFRVDVGGTRDAREN
jgi:pSer/pThr/pTyr-binding forkhead associated (FHA) protein